MRYDGLFTNLEGLVYPEMPLCYVDLTVDEIQKLINSPGKAFGGIDFGWNDPFAAHCGHLDTNDVLWIWYERYKRKTTIEDHAAKLPKLYNKSISWFADSSQPEQILKLRKGGHRVRKANKAIVAGICAVNARILTGRLKIVVNRCPAIKAETETYAYTDSEDDLGSDIPIDEFNHACDSLRYLIAGIDLKKPPSVKKRNINDFKHQHF